MKAFVSNDGFFKLNFPLKWDCELINGGTYKFEFEQGIGSFFISKLGSSAPEMFTKICNNPKAVKRDFEGIPVCEMNLEYESDFNNMIWLFEKDGIFFLSSYTYETAYRKTEGHNKELKAIETIIGSVKIIKEKDRETEISWYKLGKFTEAVGAADELYIRASKHGCFIECVCLLANQIDALLRISLILDKQIKNKNSDVDLKLIYQGKDDKPISEKEIYRLAKDSGVIDDVTYNELMVIYNERNKVVHRYIISEITTKKILRIAISYSELYEALFDTVCQLEKKQIDLKIGMTRPHIKRNKAQFDMAKEVLKDAIKDKHGRIDLDKTI